MLEFAQIELEDVEAWVPNVAELESVLQRLRLGCARIDASLDEIKLSNKRLDALAVKEDLEDLEDLEEEGLEEGEVGRKHARRAGVSIAPTRSTPFAKNDLHDIYRFPPYTYAGGPLPRRNFGESRDVRRARQGARQVSLHGGEDGAPHGDSRASRAASVSCFECAGLLLFSSFLTPLPAGRLESAPHLVDEMWLKVNGIAKTDGIESVLSLVEQARGVKGYFVAETRETANEKHTHSHY